MEKFEKDPTLRTPAPQDDDRDIIAARRESAAPAPKPAQSAGGYPAERRRAVPRPAPGAARPGAGARPAPGAARPAARPGVSAHPTPGARPVPGAARPNPRPAPGAARPVQKNAGSAPRAVPYRPAPNAPKASAASAPTSEPKTQTMSAALSGQTPGNAAFPAAASVSKRPGKEKTTRKTAEMVERKATLKERRQKVTADGRKVEIRDRGGVSSSILKALVYIAFVLIVSGFLAVYGIRAANDIFAFVKDDVSVEVNIPTEATLSDVSSILYDNGLIEDANWFKWYTSFKYRKSDAPTFVSGVHTLSSAMNYNAMIAELTPKSGRTIVTVTIPEGYTVDEIIDLFLEKGIGTREGFVDAIQNYDYSYQFLDVLKSIDLSENRKYRLEGYLFPDTYEFYSDSSEVAIIDKMLADFQYRFEDSDYDRCLALGMNLDEIITLASIIQEEAHYSSDMYYISAVFHNRLNNSAQFAYLQSDATVQYALPEHKEHLTSEDLQTDSPYNTHLYKGLPPGAICNPGIDAITAALYPEDYLAESGQKSYYFIAGPDGYSLFAATYDGHLRNQATVEAQAAA